MFLCVTGVIFTAFLFPAVVLHDNRDDVTALHCKVICLVQNGSFKEALNVMNTHSKVLGR